MTTSTRVHTRRRRRALLAYAGDPSAAGSSFSGYELLNTRLALDYDVWGMRDASPPRYVGELAANKVRFFVELLASLCFVSILSVYFSAIVFVHSSLERVKWPWMHNSLTKQRVRP